MVPYKTKYISGLTLNSFPFILMKMLYFVQKGNVKLYLKPQIRALDISLIYHHGSPLFFLLSMILIKINNMSLCSFYNIGIQRHIRGI